MDLVGSLSETFSGSAHIDDDWVDRMSRTFSVALFIICTVAISTKQYVGDPINCWCPAYFPKNYVEYTEKVCWVSNTYYISMDEKIPDNDSMKPHLTYYQWTPFILLFQGMMFYMPCMLWRALNDKSGIDVSNIIEAAKNFQKASNFEERDSMIKYITKHLDRHMDLRSRRRRQAGYKGAVLESLMCCMCSRQRSNYLVVLYLFMKVLYLANALGQLFLLNLFLGTDYNMYGIHVLRQLIAGEDLDESEQFPRVTLCDFKVRQLGNLHRYTVQCVLQINLFNEKIFIFVWWWLIFITTVTLISLISWSLKVFGTSSRVRYVKRHIKAFQAMGRLQGESDKRLCREFCTSYFKEDGVFTLRMVSKNASDIVVTEIINALWENYRDFKPHRGDFTDPDKLDTPTSI